MINQTMALHNVIDTFFVLMMDYGCCKWEALMLNGIGKYNQFITIRPFWTNVDASDTASVADSQILSADWRSILQPYRVELLYCYTPAGN